MEIPLGKDSYKRNDSVIPEVELVNYYLEVDDTKNAQVPLMRMQRPGLKLLQFIGDGVIKGMYQQDGLLENKTFISAESELQVINGSTNIPVGIIPNDWSYTRFAGASVGKNQFLGIVVSDGFYIYNGTTTTKVAIPEDYEPIDVVSIAGYFVIGCSTGRAYFMPPGEDTIDPLNYFTAEASSDRLVGLCRLRDAVLFFGSNSIEAWQLSGDSTKPFVRSSGVTVDNGCAYQLSITSFDNTVLYIGDDLLVYRFAGNGSQRVSNTGIEERIRNARGPISAWSYSLDGHLFYVMRIPGQGTFAFDQATEAWSEYRSNDNPAHVYPAPDGSFGEQAETNPTPATNNYWRAIGGRQIGRDLVCYDGDTGMIWTLDRTLYVDEHWDIATSSKINVPITRIVTGSVIFQNNRPIRMGNISLSIGVSDDCSVELAVKDGSDPYSDGIDLQVRKNFDNVTAYRLGQARQPLRTVKLTITDPIKAVIYSAAFNEGVGRGNKRNG